MNSQFDILNSFDDSIAVIDYNGLILFTNYSWKQFCLNNSGDINKTNVGINYLEVCNRAKGEDYPFAQNAINGIFKIINAELTIFEMEYPCHSKHEKRWFILRATPIKGPENLILLSHINISKRKITEELVEKKNNQLNEINSRLSSSMYKIVHDIQSPLNSIEGLINLSKTKQNILETKQIFAIVEKSILNLKDFIQETLKLTTSDYKDDSIEFKTILEEYYDSIKYSEILKIVDIKFDIIQNTKFINNKLEVISIISNIISNSLKYYNPKKKKPFIIVSIIVSKEEAKISIKDNGIGISQEFLSKIFELNFQVKKNLNQGAGVGLYLVGKAVKFLNGQLEIHSKIGEGTEVNIVIPNKNSLVD